LELKIQYEELPFMIPAPSQGVVTIAGHKDNIEINKILQNISDRETQLCVEVERNFLKTLEGGCTAPIGGFAKIDGDQIHFVGRLCSLDGNRCLEINETINKNETNIGEKFAKIILQQGGKELMQEIKALIKQ
jgi:hydroxymethylbilane synthase